MDLNYIAIVLLLALLSLAIFNYLKWRREFVDVVDKIPGPKSLPIIGNMVEFISLKNTDELMTYELEAFKKYGPIRRTWIGNKVTIDLGGGNLHEPIFSSMKHLEKPPLYNLMQKWFGEGLFLANGAKWQTHRKMITPTFHFKILENFHQVMIENTEILIEKLKEASVNGKVFNVFPFITHATLDIICETAMGVNINAQANAPSEYVAAIYWYLEQFTYRSFKPWLSIDCIYNMTEMGKKSVKALEKLHGFTNRVIEERKNKRKTEGHSPVITNNTELDIEKKKKIAFLDMLLDIADKDPRLTDENIRNEVDTFMFGGHDTTTAATCWSLYLLGRHPDIQERVYQEICEVFNGEDRRITFKDLNEFSYLERVIKEVMRLYPSVPGFGRKMEEDVTIGGYVVPAGCYVFLNLYQLHRDPKHFSNPEKFDPDNFLPENVRKRYPYAYLPFSAGPRNCIGQKFAMVEEKTLLAMLLRKFKVTSVEKPEDLILLPHVILRPKNGVNIKLELRK